MFDLPLARRQLLRAGLGLCAALPLALRAQGTNASADWEVIELRPREVSRTRRPPPPTMAIEFAGQRVNPAARWDALTDDERAAVRLLQPGPLADTDLPAYPRLGLVPLTERFRVVRGPVGQPLRVAVEVDPYGTPQRVAVDGRVSATFSRQMFGLLHDASFKPGTCDGKACTRVFVMDLVYLGAEG